jgi:endo-1,4-beta-xylanase
MVVATHKVRLFSGYVNSRSLVVVLKRPGDRGSVARVRTSLVVVAMALTPLAPFDVAAESTPAPAPAPAFMTWVNTSAEIAPGVEHKTYFSPAMKTAVGYNVYLPPGYPGTGVRYPVIYWLHGRGGTEYGSLVMARQLDQAIKAGAVPPTIMVFVNGGAQSLYSDSFDRRYLSETTVIRELLPHIDRTYRTVADRKGRAIQGMSMGGAGAMKLGLKFPELFGSVVAFAGGYVDVDFLAARAPEIFAKVFGSDRERFKANDPFEIARRQKNQVNGHLPIKMYVGTADVSLDQSRRFHAHLDALGIAHEYVEIEGIPHSLTALAGGVKASNLTFAATHFHVLGPIDKH